MIDQRYSPREPGSVLPELEPMFAQLWNELAPEFEMWSRIEDFGRRVTAGILKNSIAVTLVLKKGGRARATPISNDEIAKIRTHLRSATDDLALPFR